MSSPFRLLAPIFLIAAAVVFLLDQAGVFGLGWILNFFWPGLLLAFGVEAWERGARGWGGALLGVGAVALADNFDLLHFGLQRFWPLALAVVGICLIAERQ